MKKVMMLIFLCLLGVGFVSADATVEIMDLNAKIMRVGYVYEESREAAKDDTIPLNGYEFADGDIRVISVRELNTEQKLKYEIVKRGKKQSVKIYYPDPLPKDGNYKVECIVEAKTDNIKKTSGGMYEFDFTTRHDAYFILPAKHFVVYSNLPILLFDKKGQIIVMVKADKFGNPHKIVLRTKTYER